MNIPFGLSTQAVILLLTFVLTLFAGPVLIPLLTRLKFGQTVRDDGPASHFKKTGTPTIGGLIFIIPIIVVTAIYSRTYPEILPLLFVTLGFGAVGFIDDFIKVVRKRKDGLLWNHKILAHLFVATVFSFYIAQYTDIGSEIIIPFAGMDVTLNLAWLFVPFTIFVLIATVNSVNLTDGLDGLAAGITLIVAVFFTIVAMTRSEWDYVKVFTSMIAGGCLGFLSFNIHPARIFMGDTGSQALGGAVGAVAIVMKMPLIIIIVGAVYVAEALSDIIQVGSYKLRGKRVFKMAPLHHHFELSGWKETKVVAVFWTATFIFCLVGFVALRLRFF